MTDQIKSIFSNTKTIAVVGLSDKPERASYKVARYLQEQGFAIIPVNPNIKNVLGETAYASLSDISVPVDVVDIFRKSEDVGPIVDEAIKIGAKVIWMQEGIVNDNASQKAQSVGLTVVMDKCILKEHRSRVSGPDQPFHTNKGR